MGIIKYIVVLTQRGLMLGITMDGSESSLSSSSPSMPTRQTELPELPFLIHPRRTRTELALILLV